MRRYAIPIVILVLLGGFAAWWLSPVQVVKRRTTKLLSVMTISEASGKAGRNLGVYSLNPLIAEELVLETPTIEEANGKFPRDQIEMGFSWLSQQAKFTEFELEKFDSVTVDGDEATVRATINGVVALPDYRPADGKYEVELNWQRAKDGWRLKRANWVESR